MKDSTMIKYLTNIYGKECMFFQAHCDMEQFKKFVFENYVSRYPSKREAMINILEKRIKKLTVHHFKHKSEGGETIPSNCCLVCRLAHDYLHFLPREKEEELNNQIREYKQILDEKNAEKSKNQNRAESIKETAHKSPMKYTDYVESLVRSLLISIDALSATTLAESLVEPSDEALDESQDEPFTVLCSTFTSVGEPESEKSPASSIEFNKSDFITDPNSYFEIPVTSARPKKSKTHKRPNNKSAKKNVSTRKDKNSITQKMLEYIDR